MVRKAQDGFALGLMTHQQHIQERISFLEDQLASLDHYLPETYQLLIQELDAQHHDLMKIKIQIFYHHQNHDQQNQGPDQRNQKQTKVQDHR
jgi:hypothetical protein